MLVDYIFSEKGKMALVKVFGRKPKFAAEYADIRGGMSDAVRRKWVVEVMVECSMYHKVAGLFVEKWVWARK